MVSSLWLYSRGKEQTAIWSRNRGITSSTELCLYPLDSIHKIQPCACDVSRDAWEYPPRGCTPNKRTWTKPPLNESPRPGPAGALPGPNHADQRQPRVAADHTGVRLLRGVSTQVRQRHRLALLHRDLRLPQLVCNHRRQGLYGRCSQWPHIRMVQNLWCPGTFYVVVKDVITFHCPKDLKIQRCCYIVFFIADWVGN